jgi:pheromone shutdown protein TraB
MAYELHKSCAYYIEQQHEQNANETSANNTATRDRMSICTELVAMNRAQKSSLTLDAFLQSTCLDTSLSNNKEQPKQPSVIAIIGSNHLEGVCKLLENERVWSHRALSEVVETIRYPRNNAYTLEIVDGVEEYDRGIRENSNRR